MAVTITWTGTTSGSQNVLSNPNPIYFQAGTYTITVDSPIASTLSATAPGGGGGTADFGSGGSIQNGGGGGGGGCYSSGTAVSFLPLSTYTLTVPAAAATDANGSALTFAGTSEGTILSLQGGRAGQKASAGGAGGIGGASGSSTGSNLVSGTSGGQGGVEASGGSTAGTNNSSGAAGGGGGGSADGIGPARAGGNGLNETGQAAQASTGGHGGGVDVNGTKCGGGGGGGTNNNSNDVAGQVSEAGGATFGSFVAAVPGFLIFC